jgi:hypothetical protein
MLFLVLRSRAKSEAVQRRLLLAPSRVGLGGMTFFALIHACNVARDIPTLTAASSVVQVLRIIVRDIIIIFDNCPVFS